MSTILVASLVAACADDDRSSGAAPHGDAGATFGDAGGPSSTDDGGVPPPADAGASDAAKTTEGGSPAPSCRWSKVEQIEGTTIANTNGRLTIEDPTPPSRKRLAWLETELPRSGSAEVAVTVASFSGTDDSMLMFSLDCTGAARLGAFVYREDGVYKLGVNPGDSAQSTVADPANKRLTLRVDETTATATISEGDDTLLSASETLVAATPDGKCTVSLLAGSGKSGAAFRAELDDVVAAGATTCVDDFSGPGSY